MKNVFKTTGFLLSTLVLVALIGVFTGFGTIDASAAVDATVSGGCDGNHTGWTGLKEPPSGKYTNTITKSGNYYIEESYAVTTYEPAITIECSGTVTLCLNGLDVGHVGESSRVIYIRPTGNFTFNLCDCVGTGEIYHQNGKGGINILTAENATEIIFNMYGGTIRDCTSGVITSYITTFNMYGGTFKNCSYYAIFQGSDKDNEAKEWDEFERSILVKLADDVVVGVKGKNVSIIIKKKFQ